MIIKTKSLLRSLMIFLVIQNGVAQAEIGFFIIHQIKIYKSPSESFHGACLQQLSPMNTEHTYDLPSGCRIPLPNCSCSARAHCLSRRTGGRSRTAPGSLCRSCT